MRHRLLVLLTDGESREYAPSSVASSLRVAGVGLILVRFWSGSDRVYARGRVLADYRPDTASSAPLARLARQTAGRRLFDARSSDAVAGAVRHALGRGPTVAEARSRRTLPLAPYAVALAALPLGALLLRRGGPTRG